MIYNEFGPPRSSYALSFSNSVLTFLHANMKFFSSTVLVLAALAAPIRGAVLYKRGVPTYSSIAGLGAGQQYTKSFRAAPELRSAASAQQYVSQPQYSGSGAQQYYQQVEPQAVAYTQQPVSKYSSVPAVQKYSLPAPQPQHQPQQYSSAADVSSFSYSSPVVSYNNQGYLHQIIGKGAGAQQQQQQAAYSAAPSPKIQYASAPSQYSSPQSNYDVQTTYQSVGQKSAYSEAPQYQAQPQAYSQAQYYAQTAQDADAQSQPKAPSQPQHGGAQAITFQSTSPVSQKLSYSGPSYQVFKGLQKPQVNYITSPQQFAYAAPQAPSAQGYEAASHSTPQLFYSQPAAQPQYYSGPQSSKYSRPGVTYVQ